MLRGFVGSSNIAVVTVVDEEMAAAMGILGTSHNLWGTPYYVAPGATDPYSVIVRQCSSRSNVPAEQTVAGIIQDFRPAFLILAGIAGGLGRDGVRLGDVVIADHIDYSEFSKLEKNAMWPRRLAYDHPSLYLYDWIASPLRWTSAWVADIASVRPDGEGPPKVHVGNLVAGEKILGDPESGYQMDVLARYDKALAVEMEAYGFARAAYQARRSVHYNPQILVVRGISDLVNDPQNNQTRKLWARYAAEAAMAVTKAVIDRLLAAGVDLPSDGTPPPEVPSASPSLPARMG